MINLFISADATACGHVFHRSCIVFFIAENNFCPYCKKPCSLKQLIKLRWHMIAVEDQLELYEEMKKLNNELLEKFPILTNEINEKDKNLDDLE